MSTGLLPTVEAPAPAQPDRKVEYLAGGDRIGLSPSAAMALSQTVDDLEREFGGRLWETMMTDPAVEAGVEVLIAAVLSEPMQCSPQPQMVPEAGKDPNPRQKLAGDVCGAWARWLKSLRSPLEVTIAEMVRDGLSRGSDLFEQVYRDGDGEDSGRLVLEALASKPHRSWAWVVDPQGKVLGILGAIPWGAVPDPVPLGNWVGAISGGSVGQSAFLPREKFAIFTWDSRDGDPRGHSALRSAYNPWNLKLRALKNYAEYLDQFASGKLKGTTGPDATSTWEDDPENPGEKVEVTAEAHMGRVLEAFVNGRWIVVPHGSTVDSIPPVGDGKHFPAALAWYDQQIFLAIVNQSRAMQEAKNSSKADSSTSQDEKDNLVRRIRGAICETFRRDVLIPGTRYNWGTDSADLVPVLSLGATEHQDQADQWRAAASVGYQITASQHLPLSAKLGLPLPQPGEEPVRKAPDGPQGEREDPDTEEPGAGGPARRGAA